jgi:hypothetical protein
MSWIVILRIFLFIVDNWDKFSDDERVLVSNALEDVLTVKKEKVIKDYQNV